MAIRTTPRGLHRVFAALLCIASALGAMAVSLFSDPHSVRWGLVVYTVIAGACLLALGPTGALLYGLRRRRAWAPGLGLVRAIFSALFVAALGLAGPFAVLMVGLASPREPDNAFLWGAAYLLALISEILLLSGGIAAWRGRSRRASTPGGAGSGDV